MNFWIISDTHFGHRKMVEYCGRPINFNEIILRNIQELVQPEDVLIHLGDFCVGQDSTWHDIFTNLPGKKWLILGNHDKKSLSWYMSHGWDFVGNSLILKYQSTRILFTHMPKPRFNVIVTDINVHGHLHNNDHRKHESVWFYQEQYNKLFSLEQQDYKPVLLDQFIKEKEVFNNG